MGQGSDHRGTVMLWRPTAQTELDLVAATGWKAWPTSLPTGRFDAYLQRQSAEHIAQTSLATAAGVGYVTSFDVRSEFVDHCPRYRIGSGNNMGYDLPEAEIPSLNENIVGAIIEQADYRAALADAEFAGGQASALPQPWRRYLQHSSWFRRGWLPSGCYLWLYTPREGLELAEAWGEDSVGAHPGIAIIGGNGSREHLALDLRHDDPPVVLVDAFASQGWTDALVQAPSVAHFIDLLEAGTFDFAWD